MHILEQWLRKEGFRVEASIPNGAQELRVVRIADKNDLSGVVSIGIRDRERGIVCLRNRDDVITVSHAAVEEVYNAVSAAFEYYNSWENSLLRSVFEGVSLQELLDIAHLAFMRPMLIQNSQYEIVAITDSYGPINTIWEKYLNEGRGGGKPFHLWFSRDRFNARSDRAALTEPSIQTSQTNHGKFNLANLFLQGVRVGHITMYEQTRPFYPGDLQLMRSFREIVSFYISSDRSVLFEQSLPDMWLEEKLGGTPVPGEQITLRAVYRSTGWSEEDSFAVAHFALSAEAAQDEYDWIQNEINLDFSDVHTVFAPQGVEALFHLREDGDYDALVSSLKAIRFPEILSWGLSQPFTGLRELERYGQLARLAAAEAGRRNEAGLTLQEAGLGILLRDAAFRERLGGMLHPGYGKLIAYDKKENTRLAETLFWYLYCNCSYSDTAARMDTHRNTIYYRVARAYTLLEPAGMKSLASRLLYQISYLSEHPEVLEK